MREILFRGKITQDEWVYGFYENVKLEEATIHFVNGKIVYPKTVGQYTGLNDKNGKKIFEGDIMRLCSGTYPCLVYWDGMGWAWLMNGKRRTIDLTREKMSIIGNIHDNPELLEVEE